MTLKDLISQFLQTNDDCPELFFVDEIKDKTVALVWPYGIRCRHGWGLALIGDDSVVYTDSIYTSREIKAYEPDFFTLLLAALRLKHTYYENLNCVRYNQIPPK